MFFNSSLLKELPVLSIYCLNLLSDATIPYHRYPLTSEVTQEAKQLLRMFSGKPLEGVPHIL
ncbi:hypothetical protein TVAG_454430 [Trichomonas vaginalis G3]|uniref:Uncharacterized protein n=1 Tax=Trichomonas vaginalis (strain ATCC PRA-98 / G3) TaxID=412133 RepID=A2EU56_TRIV3|nr:phosphoribulokinase uridine kinase family [Trichomonas vaginalis G3]XP_001316027.1 phosphoribulokinase uridine kinase family [Trichomonas vaginalis G3]XP_051083629.1 phosphoribulokinase uridine kinase family [Trichomonas vaginalis G3]EAX80934.1 hypothetical protein TVAG_538340 [Trichomonas vaginalis G3]EAX84342.1 hypothetical protein TVAG_203270 [Trichomonas vaginalis G3]EAY03804.1 hypothetical protein TVAG_454430 [Trichomonas vaginalis G3]KAI5498044.1 phosphoribulokinase uridine kinase fa|eukprot:XP_001293864.1 hypothetical protein [Trichomonas vaginalis G3]